ncbi:MAG: hypothetical protein K8S87_12100 [Planctomycetes bacterium]|nr:hypothetical protein [Planctomycetota bacterium]
MYKTKYWLFIFSLLVLCISISCEAMGYNPLKIKQDPTLFQAGTTPDKSFRILQLSFLKNDPKIFYYMLSERVRKDFPYWRIANQWPEIRKSLGEDLINARVLKSEYLKVSPMSPSAASRFAVEYQHPQQDTVVENFLFLLEIAPEFGEKRPSWRLYFPYNKYQENAIWFTLLTGKIVKE